MAGKPWKGWVCGCCQERLEESELSQSVGWWDGEEEHRAHEVEYLADYCGDQPRYETAYCGPVRHYPRGSES